MAIFARRCHGCGRADAVVCPECRRGLAPPPDAPGTTIPVLAAASYEGVARSLVHALKFRDGRRVVGFLADLIVVALGDRRFTEPVSAVDLVVWVPTTPQQRRHRGHDQAELLARAVARRLGHPVAGALRRPRGARPQSGRSFAERRANAAGAFVVAPRARLVDRRVLVVDDVCTTGATLDAAAEVLRRAGAASVLAAVVAQTPAGARAGPIGPSGGSWHGSIRR